MYFKLASKISEFDAPRLLHQWICDKKVYLVRIVSLQYIKTMIGTAIRNIDTFILENVGKNIKTRINGVVRQDGGHIEKNQFLNESSFTVLAFHWIYLAGTKKHWNYKMHGHHN